MKLIKIYIKNNDNYINLQPFLSTTQILLIEINFTKKDGRGEVGGKVKN